MSLYKTSINKEDLNSAYEFHNKKYNTFNEFKSNIDKQINNSLHEIENGKVVSMEYVAQEMKGKSRYNETI